METVAESRERGSAQVPVLRNRIFCSTFPLAPYPYTHTQTYMRDALAVSR